MQLPYFHRFANDNFIMRLKAKCYLLPKLVPRVLLHSSLKSERKTGPSRIGVNPGNEVVCFYHLQSSYVKHTPSPHPKIPLIN